jgi:hypothetical protein
MQYSSISQRRIGRGYDRLHFIDEHSMALKIVIDNAVLRGSPQEQFWQRVATAYPPTGEEYRVYAPPKATGNAVGWSEHFSVRQLSESGMGENFIEDGLKYSIINQVKEELEKHELDADIWRDVNSQGRYCAAQICLRGHVHSIDGSPFKPDERCEQCGQICIDHCQNCKAPIRGARVYSGDYTLPFYCYKCGRPYPWMQERLRTAKDLLDHDDKLLLADRERLWDLLEYVMSDPKSDLAPAKKKLIEIDLEKAKAETKDFIQGVIAKMGVEAMKG